MTVAPDVSIIIPVYNVEEQIERCVRSLLEQTFYNIEFLFVDDGSTDKSVEILKRIIEFYPDRSHQVIIIKHELNKGVAAARNTGLNNARGVYFLQIDSDDWVERSMVQELYTTAIENDSAIVWSDFYIEFPGIEKNTIYNNQNVPPEATECIKGILSGYLHAGLWNKLIKRRVINDNNIQFPEEVTICEDMVFVIRFLLYIKKTTYVHKAFYHYVQNPASITIARTRQSFESEFNVVKLLEEILQYEAYGEYLMIHKARIKRNVFFSGLFSNEDFLGIYPESNSYAYIGLGWTGKIVMWLSLRKHFKLSHMVVLYSSKNSI